MSKMLCRPAEHIFTEHLVTHFSGIDISRPPHVGCAWVIGSPHRGHESAFSDHGPARTAGAVR